MRVPNVGHAPNSPREPGQLSLAKPARRPRQGQESHSSFQGWAGGWRGKCGRTYTLPESIDNGLVQHNHAQSAPRVCRCKTSAARSSAQCNARRARRGRTSLRARWEQAAGSEAHQSKNSACPARLRRGFGASLRQAFLRLTGEGPFDGVNIHGQSDFGAGGWQLREERLLQS